MRLTFSKLKDGAKFTWLSQKMTKIDSHWAKSGSRQEYLFSGHELVEIPDTTDECWEELFLQYYQPIGIKP
jgi:hypothetical protein